MTEPNTAPSNVAKNALRTYEVMFIIQPEMLENKVQKYLKDFEKFIEELGGKITFTDFWGKKNLAYAIKQFNNGIYNLNHIQIPADKLKDLDEHLRIDPNILRHMVISIPADYEYVEYKEEDVEVKKEEKKTGKSAPKAKNTSIKHAPPVSSEEKKEAKVEKEKAEKETPKEVDEDALDKKLDEIIGGDDLNL